MIHYGKLKHLPLGSVRPLHFLREQMERNRRGMGENLRKLAPEFIGEPYTRGVLDSASKPCYPGWQAEISGVYWTGLTELAFVLGDEGLQEEAARWVEAVLARQEPDGYLGVYGPDDDRAEDYCAWGAYCGMTALIGFYEARGDKKVREALIRCAQWFVKNWAGDRKTRYCGFSVCEILLWCYGETGEAEFVQFAEDYVQFLGEEELYNNSLKSMLREELESYENHTVAALVTARIYLDLYDATGKTVYLRAARKYLKKLDEKSLLINGGYVSDSEWIGDKRPNSEVEYCVFRTAQQLYARFAECTGEAQWGDSLERTFYNGAQGARKKDERAMAYYSRPNQTYAGVSSDDVGDRGREVYTPLYATACCPVMSIAILPEFVQQSVCEDGEGGLFILAYGAKHIDYRGCMITESGDYPFGNRVRYHFSGDTAELKNFRLRCPAWCRSFTVWKGGKEISAVREDNWISLQKEYLAGCITVVFEREVRVSALDDRAGHEPLAFEYGALVFSLPIREKWQVLEDFKETLVPLPEDWHSYEVVPDIADETDDPYSVLGERKNVSEWFVAVDEKIAAEEIAVEERPVAGYPWEAPPVTLTLDMYRAPYLFPPQVFSTRDYSGKYAGVREKKKVTLVPYGCTALRLTYFQRARPTSSGKTDRGSRSEKS